MAAGLVVPLRRQRSDEHLSIATLVPSGRSILVAFFLLLAGVGCWWLARESSLFAVQRLEVTGAPPHVARRVERTLRADLGTSLLALDLGRVHDRVLGLPVVRTATLDRAFPNTLRIVVVAEHPVALIRQGAASWLVSTRGKVLAPVARGARGRLPRIWVPRTARIAPGSVLAGDARSAVAAVSALGKVTLGKGTLRARVATARAQPDDLTLVLRSGLQLRLGETTDLGLKLRVAGSVLPRVAEGTAYLDLSVPERPVAGPTSTLR